MPTAFCSLRKKQTKLALTPLPSSSPASSKYPPQVREKAASVRYDSPSPSKKRRVTAASSKAEVSNAPLLTPLPSSQLYQGGDSQESTHLAQSTKLDSSPLAPTQRKAYKNPFSHERRSTLRSRKNLSKISSLEPVLRLDSTSSSSSELLEKSLSPQPPIKNDVGTQSNTTAESSSEEDLPLRSRRLRNDGQKATDPNANEGSPSRAKRASGQPVPSTRSSRAVINLSSASESDFPLGNPSSSTRSNRKALKPDPRTHSVSEEPITPPAQTKSRGSVNNKENMSSDSANDSEDVVTTGKRRRLVRPTASYPKDVKKSGRNSSEDDIEEDLEDLQDTEVQTTRTRGKIVDSKKAKVQAQMQLLRQRRAGNKNNLLSSDEENGTPQIDDGNDDDFPEDARDEVAGSDLEGFITEDENLPLGAPSALDEMPLEFSRHARKSSKEYFKDVVEWMVHKKLNPAFPRNDPLYSMAFFKMKDVVTGYAGSKFVSAAWTNDFTAALKARPVIMETERRTSPLDDGCHACNRSSHPATFIIEFSGQPYNPETLEIISDDKGSSEDEDEDHEDEDKDEDGEKKERGHDGQMIPSAERQFLVGQFCKKNAVIAHSLHHWRWHLNEWILDWLKSEGHTSPEKVVERDSWTDKKRTKYANHVVDEMEVSGEIKRLHRDFQNNLNEARDYKPPRFRNGRG